MVKAVLPGFSFGGETTLIVSIMPVSPGLAGVMLVFRLVHITATLFMMVALFGAKSTREYMRRSRSKTIQEAASWSEDFHYDFAKANIPITGVVLLLCVCDISLVQMLPWKDTAFFKESKGFPNKSLMRFALGSDIVQASVSALCSIIYIGSAMARNAKNPTTSPEAQAFFGINITVSLLTVTMSFMLLYLKDRLLTMDAEQEDTDAAGVAAEQMHDNPLRGPDEEQGQGEGEGEGEGEGGVEAEVSGGVSIAEESRPESNNDDADIEMSQIYKDSATNGDVIPTHQNPMHDRFPEDRIRLDENITSVQAQNKDLMSKNADLEFENKNLIGQNQILQQRVQDLESQERNREE